MPPKYHYPDSTFEISRTPLSGHYFWDLQRAPRDLHLQITFETSNRYPDALFRTLLVRLPERGRRPYPDTTLDITRRPVPLLLRLPDSFQKLLSRHYF
eukprot:11571041-Karenia_brevis.AAC.1